MLLLVGQSPRYLLSLHRLQLNIRNHWKKLYILKTFLDEVDGIHAGMFNFLALLSMSLDIRKSKYTRIFPRITQVNRTMGAEINQVFILRGPSDYKIVVQVLT